MEEHELGLYLPDGFESREDIMRKLAPDTVEFITPISADHRTFQEYATLFERRQDEREQSFHIPEHVEIKINTSQPILLIPFGDIHGGGEEVDYHRFTGELVQAVATDGVFCFTLGDVTNSMFWGGSGQDHDIGSFGEQNNYLRAGLKLLSDNKKLLASWGGDHDKWSAERGETIYTSFGNMGVHYLEGVSYVTLHVGEQEYKIAGAHRHNGFSIYNKSHAAMAMYTRGGAEGSDIVLTAHMHKKGYNQQPVKRFGGRQDVVHFISIGAYKRSDEYLRKQGFHRLGDEEIGAQAILLYPDRKQVEVLWDVQTGLERLQTERKK